jgi:hypothetical protein
MAMQFLIPNGASPTTAALLKVTTGTSIKTMVQVVLGATVTGKLIEWGISFDGSSAATPIAVECLETTTVAATVTASAAADINKWGDTNIGTPSTALFQIGTALTGYTASAEGTITATRMFDAQLVAPTGQYVKQFPLGREPYLVGGNVNRIRVTAGAAVNAYCYMLIEL